MEHSDNIFLENLNNKSVIDVTKFKVAENGAGLNLHADVSIFAF